MFKAKYTDHSLILIYYFSTIESESGFVCFRLWRERYIMKCINIK